MVGGGSRRDEGSMVINNTNGFAALESLRKKKKSDKEKNKKKVQAKSEPQVYWAPAPLTGKSWADVEDDEGDDYFATTAPIQSVWRTSESENIEEEHSHGEESESEDLLDEGDDDVGEEHADDHETALPPEPVETKPAETPVVPKEADRQLSKKERKKKELAELEALLADFGVSQTPNQGQDESHGAAQEKKEEKSIGDGEKDNAVPTVSKTTKKKKKKEKSSKEIKETTQDQSNGSDLSNAPDEASGSSQANEEASTIDVKERLKKMTSVKKKKPSKEVNGVARAAALEASARSAKLAAGKKKEKNHYNQQPVR